MKPSIKLAMLQSMADHLPMCAGSELSATLYRVMLVCASRGDVLSLRWDCPKHVQLLRFLHASLPPLTYQWVRGHLRFDGVPPAVVTMLLPEEVST